MRVGNHPFTRPPMPPSLRVIENPEPMLLYFVGSICMLHLTTSKGVTAVWVRPQLSTPPRAQACREGHTLRQPVLQHLMSMMYFIEPLLPQQCCACQMLSSQARAAHRIVVPGVELDPLLLSRCGDEGHVAGL